MRKQKFLFLFLVVGGLLFILAAALFLTKTNLSQPAQPAPLPPAQILAASPTPPPPLSGNPNDAINPEIGRVSLEKAKAAFDARSAVFIDVRSADAYAAARIPGALNIPLADIATRLNELDPNQWIITYCTWLNEHSSAGAARLLLDHAFKNVTPLLGGFAAWENAGYPVEP